MSSEKINHDQIFKNLIQEFFKEFMEGFLPEIAEEIDFSCVEFLKDEFFSDLTKGRKKLLDLVAKVRLKKGDEEYILIHTEFESRKPGKDFPERMFRYFCHLYLKLGKRIIPIVLFTDDHKWEKPVPDTFRMEFKNREYLKYFYHSIKLKHYNWRDFVNSNNPVIYALMAKMDYSRKEIAKLKLEFLRLITQAEHNKARQSFLLEFIDAYIRLNKKEQQEFQQAIEELAPKEVVNMITTFEKQGALKTAKEDVVEVLEIKFKDIPYPLKEKIEYCDDIKKLKKLFRQALRATSINELRI